MGKTVRNDDGFDDGYGDWTYRSDKKKKRARVEKIEEIHRKRRVDKMDDLEDDDA